VIKKLIVALVVLEDNLYINEGGTT